MYKYTVLWDKNGRANNYLSCVETQMKNFGDWLSARNNNKDLKKTDRQKRQRGKIKESQRDRRMISQRKIERKREKEWKKIKKERKNERKKIYLEKENERKCKEFTVGISKA